MPSVSPFLLTCEETEDHILRIGPAETEETEDQVLRIGILYTVVVVVGMFYVPGGSFFPLVVVLLLSEM